LRGLGRPYSRHRAEFIDAAPRQSGDTTETIEDLHSNLDGG
jgi:hypothetical protein